MPKQAIPEEMKPGFCLDTDMIAPRCESERYRIFRVKDGGKPEIVATVRSPEAVGVAICILGEEGMFDDYCLGVQDALDHIDEKTGKWTGKWLVLPWQAQPEKKEGDL